MTAELQLTNGQCFSRTYLGAALKDFDLSKDRLLSFKSIGQLVCRLTPGTGDSAVSSGCLTGAQNLGNACSFPVEAVQRIIVTEGSGPTPGDGRLPDAFRQRLALLRTRGAYTFRFLSRRQGFPYFYTVRCAVCADEKDFIYDCDPAHFKVRGDTLTKYLGQSEHVVIPEGMVRRIGHDAFAENITVKTVTIPDGVESIGSGAFKWCTALSCVLIPDTVCAVESAAFDHCNHLIHCSLPDQVPSIDCLFTECTRLSAFVIPQGVRSIGPFAFERCRALTDVVIPPRVRVIELSAFSDCRNLTAVTLPESLVRIEGDAFACSGLTDVVIPSRVRVIEEGAFSDCRDLTAVTLPESLVRIEETAFACCQKLKSVFYGGPKEGWLKLKPSFEPDAKVTFFTP